MDNREEILEKVNKLVDAYKEGLLGGEMQTPMWLWSRGKFEIDIL